MNQINFFSNANERNNKNQYYNKYLKIRNIMAVKKIIKLAILNNGYQINFEKNTWQLKLMGLI